MLSPDYLLHISEGAEDIAEQLHSEIVKRIVNRIMLRIGRGEDYILTATDKWQIENLQSAGYLLEDIQKEIAKATKLQQSEIAEAMEDAGVKALDYDDKIYQQAGLSPTALPQSPELVRLMQRNYDATMGEWTNFTRTTAEQSQRLFLSELDRAYTLVSTGALSYTEAVREIVNRIVSDGVKVIYPTGHEDTVETATLRAVRTGISQATAQIQIARMDEMDVDLVITSSHLGARPSHQVWQGKIFSRSGQGKYPNFVESTGYGSVSGLCGANCRHSFSPYFEGMDNPFEQYDSEENRKQYEKEQRQRTLERRIRNTKREVIGLKESVDNCKDDKLKFDLDMDYQRKSALLAKQNKAYKEYCEENNLKPLSDRIQIAKWDRQQAAAARGAAKRYENVLSADTQGDVKKLVNRIANKINDHQPIGISDLPSVHVTHINAVINSAPQQVKDFTLTKIGDIKIINERYRGAPHYTRKGMRINLERQRRDKRGAYTALFHEVGHGLDAAYGDISVLHPFKAALQKDFDDVVNSYCKYYNIGKDEAFVEISESLKEDKFHSISDLCGGLSDNKCVGRYRHKKDYWKNNLGALEKEAFAHFYEATIRNDADKLDAIKQMFPSAYRVFEDMLR